MKYSAWVLLAVAIMLLFFTVETVNADYEMYQGDPSHTGVISVQPVTNPVIAWQFVVNERLALKKYSREEIKRRVLNKESDRGIAKALGATQPCITKIRRTELKLPRNFAPGKQQPRTAR